MYEKKITQKKIAAGISLSTICRIPLYFLITILFFSISSFAKAKDHILFSDSIFVYKIRTGSIKKTALRRYVKTYPKETKKAALFNLLDSLGYFNSHTDTIAEDTIIIDIGNRSFVDTILVQSDYPLIIDSVLSLRFPIPYDAGALQSVAGKTLTFLAQRGFPFAKLSIAISDATSNDTALDTVNIGISGKHLTIQFIVDTEKRCVFDSPLFFGDFKTREKIIIRDIVFSRGKPFNIRKIETSQKRLMSRYYIEYVDVISPGIISDSQDTPTGQTATPEDFEADPVDTVAVPFVIKDKSGMGVDGAVAYNSDVKSLSGLLNLTMLNILHRGEALSLYYRGEELLQQFEVEISIPYPFTWPLFCSGSFGLEIEKDSYGYLQGEFKVLTQLKGLWQAGVSVKGHETTVKVNDSSWISWNFYGVDLILQRQVEPYRAGILSREFSMRTGTGIADRTHGKFSRWSFDFSAGSHIPLFKRQAFLGKVATKAITSDERDSLHQTEKIRIGGYRNVRGYAENYYPFKAVAYLQTEYHYYFNPTGSVYIFIDGGAGFLEQISLNADDRTDVLGFGLGIRVPVKFGTFSLEWARNYEERKGLGRIHVRFRNTLSTGMGL